MVPGSRAGHRTLGTERRITDRTTTHWQTRRDISAHQRYALQKLPSPKCRIEIGLKFPRLPFPFFPFFFLTIPLSYPLSSYHYLPHFTIFPRFFSLFLLSSHLFVPFSSYFPLFFLFPEGHTLSPARRSGVDVKLPQRVREKSGRQIICGAFWAKTALLVIENSPLFFTHKV